MDKYNPIRPNTRLLAYESDCGTMTFSERPHRPPIGWTSRPSASGMPKWLGCAGPGAIPGVAQGLGMSFGGVQESVRRSQKL